MFKMTWKKFFKDLAFIWTLGYLWVALSTGSAMGSVLAMSFFFVPWLVGVIILAVLAWAS